MSTSDVLDGLRQRIAAGYPLFFLKSWEEGRWEQALADLALEMERGLVTWSVSAGLSPAWDAAADRSCGAEELLAALDRYPPEHLFLLKDFHPFLREPEIVRQFRDRLTTWTRRRQTVLLLDPVGEVPPELAKDAVRQVLPTPDYVDLRAALDDLLKEPGDLPSGLTEAEQDQVIKGALGLTIQEARRAWRNVLQGETSLTDAAVGRLIAEKRSLAANTELLDFYDLEEGLQDVGGLDELKDWLRGRALAYSPAAKEQGVPRPRGVLLLGVQGCGKSLTARVAARVLSFPLIRLDLANLMSSGRGESERNLRDVLRLIDSIAPAVLWLDELDKGMAGVDEGSAIDPVLARMLGTFLTWLSETHQPVFVVATANSVDRLPPELLRRGRFDELFFLDLPNYYERLQVLEIHLGRRGYRPDRFDVPALAESTEGYSGAELEQVVSAAVLDAFAQGRLVTDADLQRSRRETVPLSVTMEEKIFALRQWAQTRCRRATPESRVTRMIDEERRTGPHGPVAKGGAAEAPGAVEPTAPWMQFAQAGQIKAAIVEYVRQAGETRLIDLQSAVAPWCPADGEVGLAVRANPNVVVATGLEAQFAAAIVELVSLRRLFFHPCPVDRYSPLERPRLPIVPTLTDDRLEQPGWLPCTLRVMPHYLHAARLTRLARVKLATR